MTRIRKPITIALFVFAACAVGVAWWQHTALVRAQADLARANALIAELARKPSAVAPEPAALAAATGTSPAPAMPPAAEDGGRRGRQGRFGRAMADLSSDPEIAPLMLNQRKRAVAARYAALLAKLGLPAAQTDQLTTLLAEKQISRYEAQTMARSQGLGRDQAQEIAKQSESDADAAIKAMLGESAFAQLQDFDHSYPQRTTVGSLAERLNYAGAPLPAGQQEQLIQILASTAVPVPGSRGGEPAGPPFGGGGPGGRPGGGMPVFGQDVSDADIQAYADQKAASDAVALQQASALLTPAQLAALQQIQQEENEQIKLSTLTMRRLRQARGGGGQ